VAYGSQIRPLSDSDFPVLLGMQARGSGGSEGKGTVKFLGIYFINAHDFRIDTKWPSGTGSELDRAALGGSSKWKPPIFGLERWARDADWDVAVARPKQSLPRHTARLVVRAFASRALESRGSFG